MALYAEGLNLPNHDNRRILNTTFNFATGQPGPYGRARSADYAYCGLGL
jgi:hypothetical protein